MKPVYICNLCRQWTYSKRCSSLVNNHACEGTIQPYFAASDIEKLINGRIEQHKKNILESDQCIHMDYIQAEMLQCMALEKLLSALEVGEHE